jgi:DNA invertase Pin-like site-specific DNA recombinase
MQIEDRMSYIENGYVGKDSNGKGFHYSQLSIAGKVQARLAPKRERINRILEMLKAGISYEEIAMQTKVTVSYVRQLEAKNKYEERKRKIKELTENDDIELL